MADLHPSEDQALPYLLDELSDAERREFELRLAESAELRSLLRELEEGSVALAMTVPHRRAPAQTWKRIEGVIARDQKREIVVPGFWFGWWRYGWAAAAVCLAAWLLHAFWLSRSPDSANVNSQQAIHQPDVVPNGGRGIVMTREEKGLSSSTQKESNHVAGEVVSLRGQVADLSNQIVHLSQSVARQQSLLEETNRLKFFQIGNPSEIVAAPKAPLSPGLQRALFLAMARELGWLPSGAGVTNLAGVDFVDFRTGSNVVINSQVEAQPIDSPESNLLAGVASGSIPGFQSGTNAFLAFDPAIVGPGTALSFWSGSDGQPYQLIGTSVQGNNPAVVAVPFSSGSGMTLTVIAGNGLGSSNVVGQFPPPGSP